MYIQSGNHYFLIFTSVYDDSVGICPGMQTGAEYQTVLIPELYVPQNSCSNLLTLDGTGYFCSLCIYLVISVNFKSFAYIFPNKFLSTVMNLFLSQQPASI